MSTLYILVGYVSRIFFCCFFFSFWCWIMRKSQISNENEKKKKSFIFQKCQNIFGVGWFKVGR